MTWTMNFGIPSILTDDWKNQFDMEEDTPSFYTASAEIYQSYEQENEKTTIKTEIQFFDHNDKLVIKVYTNAFAMELYEPELEPNPRWCEQNFDNLTQPIIFDLRNDDDKSVCLNNCGTEEWYEFILDSWGDDKIAEICVRQVFLHSYPYENKHG